MGKMFGGKVKFKMGSKKGKKVGGLFGGGGGKGKKGGGLFSVKKKKGW